MNLYIFETGELIKIFEKNISDDLLHYYQLYQPTLIILGPSPFQIYQLQGHTLKYPPHVEELIGRDVYFFTLKPMNEKIQFSDIHDTSLPTLLDPKNSFVREEMQVLMTKKSLEYVNRQIICLEAVFHILWDRYTQSYDSLTNEKKLVMTHQASHIRSLNSLPSVLNNLQSIPLHPSLHSGLPSHISFPTLYDTLPAQKLPIWISKAQDCHKKIDTFVEQIEKSFFECRYLISDLQQSKQSVLLHQTHLEEVAYKLENECGTLKSVSQQSQQSNYSHQDANSSTSTLSSVSSNINSTNGSNSDETPLISYQVMDITSPLRDFFQEMKESLSQVTSLCQSIRQINEQGVSIFAQVQRELSELMKGLMNTFEMIHDRGQTGVNMLRALLSKNNSHFHCIKSIERLSQSYHEFIHEIIRREKYNQNYSNYMESAQATLLQMRNDEVKKREDYMSQSGKYLPPFFHDIVPSLRMKPFVTQREKFPNLSDDDVTDIHEEKKVEKEIITSSTPCTTTDQNENLEDLFRNILLERTDDIRKFIEKDPVLRATLHSLLGTDKMEERQESIEQEFSDSHSTEILPNSSSNCNYQEDHRLIHENSSNLMLERPESPDQTEVVGPFSELLLPKVARQVSYLYTLQNVAELWSIFIDHLYTLVQFDLLPVYHNSLTALNTSNTQLTPQPDWMVCVTSHEELEILHESIKSALIDIKIVVSRYFDISKSNLSTSSPFVDTSHQSHSSLSVIASNENLLSKVITDILTNLHFTSIPLIYWDDSHYIPLSLISNITDYIDSFLYRTYIPLTEVAKVWKISSHDLQYLIQKKYLILLNYDDNIVIEGEDHEKNLIIERSSGLSIYQTTSPSPSSPTSSSMMKGRFQPLLSMSMEYLTTSPFTSTISMTKPSHMSSSSSSSSSLLLSSPYGNRGTNTNTTSRVAKNPPCPSISRIDFYAQPEIIQKNYLTNLNEICNIFGFLDLSEGIIFLTDGLDDPLHTIEWGVDIYLLTDELQTILSNKLVRLDNLPSMLGLYDLNIQYMRDKILTTRRNHHGHGTSPPPPGSSGTRGGTSSSKNCNYPLDGKEFYPVVDWLGHTYILLYDLPNILQLFRR